MWTCRACTFFNRSDGDICEVCECRHVLHTPSPHYLTTNEDVVCRCRSRTHIDCDFVLDSETRWLCRLFFDIYTTETQCSSARRLNLNFEGERHFMTRSKFGIDLMVKANPNIKNVFETFCANGHSYGEALQAVESSLFAANGYHLSSERAICLLQYLRPTRFTGTITSEAYESHDTLPTQSPAKAPRPVPSKTLSMHNGRESEALDSHTQRKETIIPAAAHTDTNEQASQQAFSSEKKARSADHLDVHTAAAGGSRTTIFCLPSDMDQFGVQQTRTSPLEPIEKAESDAINAHACFKRVQEVFPKIMTKSIRILLETKPETDPWTMSLADEIILHLLNEGFYPHGAPQLLETGVESRLFGNKLELPQDRDGPNGRGAASYSMLRDSSDHTPLSESRSRDSWQDAAVSGTAQMSSRTSASGTDGISAQIGSEPNARPIRIYERHDSPEQSRSVSDVALIHANVDSLTYNPWCEEPSASTILSLHRQPSSPRRCISRIPVPDARTLPARAHHQVRLDLLARTSTHNNWGDSQSRTAATTEATHSPYEQCEPDSIQSPSASAAAPHPHAYDAHSHAPISQFRTPHPPRAFTDPQYDHAPLQPPTRRPRYNAIVESEPESDTPVSPEAYPTQAHNPWVPRTRSPAPRSLCPAAERGRPTQLHVYPTASQRGNRDHFASPVAAVNSNSVLPREEARSLSPAGGLGRGDAVCCARAVVKGMALM